MVRSKQAPVRVIKRAEDRVPRRLEGTLTLKSFWDAVDGTPATKDEPKQ